MSAPRLLDFVWRMKVPFLDLKAHHQPVREQLDAAISAVLDTAAFAGGPFVEAFEKDFAAYCGSRFAIGVGNGTDALWLSLLALGIGPGDEVITVPSTFMATAEAISFCGATPVFVDIDERTYTMDAAQLARNITARTQAIMPVHLFGQMADMQPIVELAARHGLPVIEDACQAHGASQYSRKAGTVGATGCFSFYPGKNLGALGEAGAVITQDAELAQRIRSLRDHGQVRKYCHSYIGWNARMDGIQGAVLSVKLRKLDAHNTLRRSHAQRYDRLLKDLPGVILPSSAPANHHVYHIYALRIPQRDRVLQKLTERGIGCAIHYPVPVHLQEAYQSLGYRRGSFPVAERCAEQFLSLPMYPELTEEQIEFVASEFKACVGIGKPHECAA
jgi:dTDP-4-amino-4,6-dideoxygalactose transaminase